MTAVEPDDAPTRHGGRALALVALAAGALFVGYLVLGMPGMDHGPAEGGSMASMDHASGMYASLSAEDFAARMSQGAFVVNVHEPYEGEIDGTDAFIAYDEIAGDRRLPSDTDTPVLLYCRSGQMSVTAADALVRAGYRDVAYLDGGMDAWEAAGMPIRSARAGEDR